VARAAQVRLRIHPPEDGIDRDAIVEATDQGLEERHPHRPSRRGLARRSCPDSRVRLLPWPRTDVSRWAGPRSSGRTGRDAARSASGARGPGSGRRRCQAGRRRPRTRRSDPGRPRRRRRRDGRRSGGRSRRESRRRHRARRRRRRGSGPSRGRGRCRRGPRSGGPRRRATNGVSQRAPVAPTIGGSTSSPTAVVASPARTRRNEAARRDPRYMEGLRFGFDRPILAATRRADHRRTPSAAFDG
jgi:hypothetical protein